MSINPEIPDEAILVGHAAIAAQWAGGVAPLPITRGDFRIGLAAALPHLRVQETPALELAESARAIAACLRIDLESVDREDTRIALGNSARDVIRLAELIEAPHPRPVVDREAIDRVLRVHGIGQWGGELSAGRDFLVTALLALLNEAQPADRSSSTS